MASPPPQPPRLSAMTAKPPHSKGHDRAFSTLDALIQILEVAKGACAVPLAQVAIASTSVLLTIIRDSMANKRDYVQLGKSCGSVCQALDRGLKGRRLDDLSQSVLEAIEQLIATVTEIHGKIVARGKRNMISRALSAKDDKDAIAAWGQDLDRILNIFNTELLLNNHIILLDIRHNAMAGQEEAGGRHQSTQANTFLGELPPPPPRACFGRGDLIEKIISLAETFSPVALIGPGGIGKTSVALAVLHDDRIKQRFGDNRRFIRCDQFSTSRANFLSRLSKVIGAGVENPENLAILRPSLSSKEIFIILDNAESILDPQGTDGQEIHGIVEELSQLDNVCLCITSRITTVPPDCKCLDVPTLSMDAAHSTFYRIYDKHEQSGRINEILTRLDFHPLSVTLLATVARQNKWNTNRLVKEWRRHQTGMLQTEHSKSLAVTIELSLASPMFQQLGPEARGLLGVVAFFPQGVDESNLDWLFPTISNSDVIFDKLCILSLTYRSDGFITMLAPLRDHLCPKDPKASPLLCATKDLYVTRLSVTVDPVKPEFEDTRWITSEDANVEHLLDVFTSADPHSDKIWDGCNDFMAHLFWHKPRPTVLGPKIKQLPDDHRWKPRGLVELSQLSDSVGNYIEQKQLLAQALQLWKARTDDYWIARTLDLLACANRMLHLYEEGIQQEKEALETFERRGDTVEQVGCLITLAHLLLDDEQLDAAEETITRSIKLVEQGPEFFLCQSHRLLGDVSHYKGEREKAAHHYTVALGIASQPNWHEELFWIHHALATMFRDEGEFDNATAHITQVKQHALHDRYRLGRATEEQARIWYLEGRYEDAASEVLSAIEMYEKVGAVADLEDCKTLLQDVERAMKELSAYGEPSTDDLAPLLIPVKMWTTHLDKHPIP